MQLKISTENSSKCKRVSMTKPYTLTNGIPKDGPARTKNLTREISNLINPKLKTQNPEKGKKRRNKESNRKRRPLKDTREENLVKSTRVRTTVSLPLMRSRHPRRNNSRSKTRP